MQPHVQVAQKVPLLSLASVQSNPRDLSRTTQESCSREGMVSRLPSMLSTMPGATLLLTPVLRLRSHTADPGLMMYRNAPCGPWTPPHS